MMELLVCCCSDNNKPIRGLAVGRGNRYVVLELLKYPQIESINHVELDEGVVNISRQFFPWTENAWDNKQVNLDIEDGAEFVKQAKKSYYVIIQDASNPFWLAKDGSIDTLPSSTLFEEAHFQSLYQLLRPSEGVLVMQAETYNIPSNLESIRKWGNLLHGIRFEKPRYGTISIKTYPTAQIGFFVAHTRMVKEEICVMDDCEYQMDPLPGIDWKIGNV